MKLATGVHSQTTADAISSGSPKRPIGSRAIMAFTMSGSLFLATAVAIGVLIIPGQTALIRHHPADRRAIHNCAASLRFHLPNLRLHAVPNAAEIDADDAIEFVVAGLQQIRAARVDAGIIEGGVQPTECRYRLIDHGRDCGLFGYVAADGERLVAGGEQLLRRGADGRRVDVGKCNGGSSLCKACAVAKPMPAPVTSATFPSRQMFIADLNAGAFR